MTRYCSIPVAAFMWLTTVIAQAQTFYSQTVTNDRPLVYWNFDEGSGNALQLMPVPASPTSDNDLVPVGSASRIAHSAIDSGLLLGDAADLDGLGNFNTTTPNTGKTNLAGPFALELWMQIKPQEPGARNDYLMSFGNRGEQGIAFDWDPDILGLYGENAGQANITLSDQDSSWHHAVWVFYGSLRATNKVDVYLDGVLHTDLTPYNLPLAVGSQFTVGDYNPVGGLGFNGRLDEVAIYDWAGYTNSTETEIAAKAASLVQAHQLAKSVDATGVNLVITQQPTDETGPIGSTASFSVAASSSGPISYQWQRNWVDIPGATADSYTTPTLALEDAGDIYRVRVSSGNVFTYSREVTLTTELTITISPQPTNQFVNIGDTASFYAGASSVPTTTLNFQWMKNGSPIPNATNTSYATPTLELKDTGTNRYQLRVTAGAIVKDSNEALLVVANPAPPNTVYSQVVSNDLPLLYWNFDEPNGPATQLMPVLQGPTTENEMVPAFQATRVQQSAIGSGLRLGHAADLDGFSNFHVPAPNVSGLPSLTGAYAIEFWMQGLGVVGENNDYVLSFRGNGLLGIVYDWSDGPDYVELYGGNQDERTFTNGVSIASAIDISWHHIVWVYYGGLRAENKLDAYRDGVRVANIPSLYDQELFLLGPITLGDYRPLGGLGFRGRLDELAIYDFSAFADEATLANHVNDLVARHLGAALPDSPTLSFIRDGNQLTLSWSGTGFTLEQTANLNVPDWSPTPNGTVSPVIVNIGSDNLFFRLKK